MHARSDLGGFHQELVPAAIVCGSIIKLLSLVLCLLQISIVGLICAPAQGEPLLWLHEAGTDSLHEDRAHCVPTASAPAWKRQ